MTGPDDPITSDGEPWLEPGALLDDPTGIGGLEQLIAALRQPATPEELDGRESAVAAMQAVLAPTTPTRHPGDRSRLVGRIAIVKGAVVAGALAFGVAAAAATGMVDVPGLPSWSQPPAPANPIEPTTGNRSSQQGPESHGTGDAAADDEDDVVPPANAGGPAGSSRAPHPASSPGAADAPTPVSPSGPGSPSTSALPSSTSPSTTGPPTDPASEAEPSGPGKADPPSPPVSLPPPAHQDGHGPPENHEVPCAQASPPDDPAASRGAAEHACSLRS